MIATGLLFGELGADAGIGRSQFSLKLLVFAKAMVDIADAGQIGGAAERDFICVVDALRSTMLAPSKPTSDIDGMSRNSSKLSPPLLLAVNSSSAASRSRLCHTPVCRGT